MRVILGIVFFLCSMFICLGSYADFSSFAESGQEPVQISEGIAPSQTSESSNF